jgi:heme exporter protein A
VTKGSNFVAADDARVSEQMPVGVHSSAMPVSPIVQLENVAVRYGRVPVLTGVALEVPAGEAVGIVGPNGSGKSTLLRVLATLLRPTEGMVTVFGDQMGDETAFAIRRRIALIGHQPALYPQLTLRENLAFVARLSGHSEESVDEMLEIVGLAGAVDRRAEQSSHGMQRRVEFARIILTRPELLLLDEAHAGLDREAGMLVDAVVDNVRSRGGAAVFVSHEPDRMMPLVQATYELVGGTVVPGHTV